MSFARGNVAAERPVGRDCVCCECKRQFRGRTASSKICGFRCVLAIAVRRQRMSAERARRPRRLIPYAGAEPDYRRAEARAG